MNEKEQEWRKERDDRSLRYAGRVFDRNRWIVVSVELDYASRYDGQVAILTAANLLGRMTPSVALDVPSVPLVAPLPFAGADLPEILRDRLYRADPYGNFCFRQPEKEDYVIYFGRAGFSNLVHGSGWNFYLGPGPSPLMNDETINPIGPALAAIIAVSEAFRTSLAAPSGEAVLLNALTWETGRLKPDVAPLPSQLELGTLWTVGTGSVGTAILYFLSFATQRFSAALFDMDKIKTHNLDRSPLFMDDDVEKNKVEVTRRYLNHVGVNKVQAEARSLDKAELWRTRKQGVPDIMISTANERNVRSIIENSCPPIQVYGTTGNYWQAAAIRHIPLHDPCSICLFPDENHEPTMCATDTFTRENGDDEEQVDAALPFLSFAAGAMAAAEILKLGLLGYPLSENRVVLNMGGTPIPRLVPVSLSLRPNCLCQRRSVDVHCKMIDGTRFSKLTPRASSHI